jgi:hypothetical protein
MTTVSIDLAYRNYRDFGVAVISYSAGQTNVEFPQMDLTGAPHPREVASFLIRLCEEHGAKTLLLDGPQGWKDAANGLAHSRLCERALNTPAKTGLPGAVKPKNYGPYVAFSIAVFDALADLGWNRYTGNEPTSARIVCESFPFSAWRTLKLSPIPAKGNCPREVVAERVHALRLSLNLRFASEPNHDEVQALVAGLAGPALERRDLALIACAGVAPYVVDGSYREGLIVNPKVNSYFASARSAQRE